MFRTAEDTTSMPATVLLVNIPPSTPEGQTIRTLLDEREIRHIDVTPEGLEGTVADHLGGTNLPALDPDAPVGFEEEPVDAPENLDVSMMIMASFTREELEDLLETYRATEAPPIRLKAVATHNNIHWKLRSLAHELDREHQTMSLYSVLLRGVKAMEMMDDQEYTQASWEPFETAAVTAAGCINRLRNRQEVPIPELREAWQNFQITMNALVPRVHPSED